MKPRLTPDSLRSWSRYAVTSPLYMELCAVIAEDERLMAVINAIEHTPQPNVLFAGVQFIMRRDGGGELERHYPNFGDRDAPVAGVAGPFRDFVLANERELVEIGRTRFTQTNEPRRCVALLPAIWAGEMERFHLVDVGTSAGLNLLVDRYRYSWGDLDWGPDSPVRLTTELRGEAVSARPIEVLSRTGLDLNPVDPSDEDGRHWLEALVWPEHHERRDRLTSALSMAADTDIDFVPGDALTTLARTVAYLPEGEPVVLMHSFMLNQLSKADRSRFIDAVDHLRVGRAVLRVGMEAIDPDDDAAALTIDRGEGAESVGRAQPHGEWVELYARP